MGEMEVYIDTEEIAEFIYHELMKRGFTPGNHEVLELADIMFDYLISKQIIDEEWEES
ncbi:YozD family protein [Lederbergia sp. NSJ-179]|uniref:YozD family protein n=1 Tax=Lederbergia sp. NSJ-179 TaxID=2931402 RepID=UPI001FD0385B|nr:YozD family protein [Lederbergia sp. NSJ-179]MCJ7841148.1 YozD family protein [Lederbergia sp. NSJ-179]